MSTMVERVTDAIQDVVYISESGGLNFEEMARAAIESMREPTEEMKSAASRADADGFRAVDVWDSMIDAALKE